MNNHIEHYLDDFDKMLEHTLLTDEFIEEVNYFRERNARNTVIGIVIYIIGAAFLVGFGGFGEYLGNNESYGVIGLIILLVLSAIATALIIYTNMSTPTLYKDYYRKIDKDLAHIDSRANQF